MHKHPEKILEQLNNLYKFALFCIFNTYFAIVFRSSNLKYPSDLYFVSGLGKGKRHLCILCVCITDMIGCGWREVIGLADEPRSEDQSIFVF